jgi:hypothetical protein
MKMMMTSTLQAMYLCVLALLLATESVRAATIDFEVFGAVPDDKSNATVFANRDLFQLTLQTLKPGDRFVIPNKTYHLVGGIDVWGMSDVIIQIDGTLSFTNDRDQWPKDPTSGSVLECIFLHNITNVVFTSSGKGTLDGNGQAWWGAIQFLKHQVCAAWVVWGLLYVLYVWMSGRGRWTIPVSNCA